MERILKISLALVLSWFALSAFNSGGEHAIKLQVRTNGYGLMVGQVAPCAAKRFDASPSEPLIIILTKNAKTYVTYNVSSDAGTTTYHFDVPSGRYTLRTT